MEQNWGSHHEIWAWTHLDRLGRRVRTELSGFALCTEVCVPWDLMPPAENFIFTWELGTGGSPTAHPGRRASTARVQQEKGSWRVTERVWWWLPDPQQGRAIPGAFWGWSSHKVRLMQEDPPCAFLTPA